MENEIVSGIAYSKEEANITLINISDKPGIGIELDEGVPGWPS